MIISNIIFEFQFESNFLKL